MSHLCAQEIAQSGNEATTPQPLLSVNLEGQLLKTTLLTESALALIRQSPRYLLALPLWLLSGKARFEKQIATRISLNSADLPWRTSLVEKLKHERAQGRSLILTTTGNLQIARKLTDHLKLFDNILPATNAEPIAKTSIKIYFVLSIAYTLYIKKIAVLDVLFLAGLYTVSILAGSAATGIWPSHWLLAFSTFLFFSLALVKRYSELVIMRRSEGSRAKARGYETGDRELIAAMGIASGYLAVLVMAFYIATDKAQSLYATRELLWAMYQLLLCWISYLWLAAHRGRMSGDPVEFATSDRTSRILLVLMALTAVVAL